MKEKKISINVFLNIFRTVLNLCFPLITFPYVSRIIQAENYGKVNFGLSIISYFSLIAALGISTYAIREGGKVREKREQFEKFASEIFTINIFSTIFSYLLLITLYILWNNLHSYTALLLIQSTTIFFTTIGVEWLYSVYEDYLYITIRSIFIQILSIILLFLFVKTPDDYLIYAAISVVANGGANIFNFFHSRKYCHFHLVLNSNLKNHIIPLLLLFFSNITITIYANSDITMLNIFKGDYDVGIYSVSVKIYTILKQLVSAIFIVIMPRLSFYIANDKKKYSNLLNKLNEGILVFSIPITVGTFSLSKAIIIILSGKEFLPASFSLKILSISLFFSAFATMFGNGILLLHNKEKSILISTTIGALTNIVLNAYLIPKYSYNAAAFTTLISEFVVLTSNYLFSKKCGEYKLTLDNKTVLRIIIGAIAIYLICFIVDYLIINNLLTIFLSIIFSAFVYVVILLFNNKKIVLDFMEEKNDKEFIKNV